MTITFASAVRVSNVLNLNLEIPITCLNIRSFTLSFYDGPVFLLHNEVVLSLRLLEFLRKLTLRFQINRRVRFYVQQFLRLA